MLFLLLIGWFCLEKGRIFSQKHIMLYFINIDWFEVQKYQKKPFMIVLY